MQEDVQDPHQKVYEQQQNGGMSSGDEEPSPVKTRYEPKLKQSKIQNNNETFDPLEDFKANNMAKNVLEIKEHRKSEQEKPKKVMGALEAAIQDDGQIYDVQQDGDYQEVMNIMIAPKDGGRELFDTKPKK